MDRVALEGVAGRVRGRLGGRRFRIADARFRIVDGEGRRRVDLLLADHRLRQCGLPIVRANTAILWARFADRLALPRALYVLDRRGGPFEVHYERPFGRGMHALHRGVGRIRIERADAETIAGTLSVCFADTGVSCAAGAFEARPCVSRIDGRAIREPPGLSDDALEAVGAPR
jgi:hypothetical protein